MVIKQNHCAYFGCSMWMTWNGWSLIYWMLLLISLWLNHAFFLISVANLMNLNELFWKCFLWFFELWITLKTRRGSRTVRCTKSVVQINHGIVIESFGPWSSAFGNVGPWKSRLRHFDLDPWKFPCFNILASTLGVSELGILPRMFDTQSLAKKFGI